MQFHTHSLKPETLAILAPALAILERKGYAPTMHSPAADGFLRGLLIDNQQDVKAKSVSACKFVGSDEVHALSLVGIGDLTQPQNWFLATAETTAQEMAAGTYELFPSVVRLQDFLGHFTQHPETDIRPWFASAKRPLLVRYRDLKAALQPT